MAEVAGKADKGPGEGGGAEVMVAVVLSVSGLMTAWADYQGGLWEGQQAAFYSEAGESRTMAARAWLEVDGSRSTAGQLVALWLQASIRGEVELAAFYRSRFPADLRPAFEAWMALDPLKNPNAPAGPLTMPSYRPTGAAEAERLDKEADTATKQGQEANSISDRFTQGGLFMSTAMFFGGIGQVFKIARVRLVLLAIGTLCCAGGLLRILTLPMLRPD